MAKKKVDPKTIWSFIYNIGWESPQTALWKFDELRAFALHIAEEPDDPGYRLIFSDWLEENGFPRNAAIFRAPKGRALASGEVVSGCISYSSGAILQPPFVGERKVRHYRSLLSG